jgi:HAD superfamily hydrolase (TIGR01509 family)
MAIRCVCFDVGGVLVKIRSTWQEISQAVGIPISITDKHDGMISHMKCLRLFEAGLWSEDEYLDSLADYLHVSKEQALKCHQAVLTEERLGVLPLISGLREHRYYTACLSNVNTTHWNILSNTASFPGLASLDKQVLSYECGVLKPDPIIYLKFEELTGFAADEILYFDDLEPNVIVAIGQGWNAVQIDPRGDVISQFMSTFENYNVLT